MDMFDWTKKNLFRSSRADEQTKLGVLPRDEAFRQDDEFEVIVLGKARSRVPTEALLLRLALGSVTRELAVVGERHWVRSGATAVASRPAPFTEMPLTWERAFGGRHDVLIDRDAYVPISHPLNADGKGFDPKPAASGLCRQLGAPSGYPVLPSEMELPNLERREALITAYGDEPLPTCWATMPLSNGLLSLRAVGADKVDWHKLSMSRRATQEVSEAMQSLGPAIPEPEDLITSSHTWFRAHPDWIIERPDAGARIAMQGLHLHEQAPFALPRLRVLADYVVEPHSGCQELKPHTLVLLPEDSRFYLVYRFVFNFDYQPASDRALRLRLEPGWYGEA